MDLLELQPGFFSGSTIGKPDILWRSPMEEPFRIHGLVKTAPNAWRRMPECVAEKVSEGVKRLNFHTAGGRVRFRTDSEYVALRAKPREPGGMPHMAMTGITGCDLYADGIFAGCYRPENMSGAIYEGVIALRPGMKEITINLPLYNGLANLAIGLDKNAALAEPKPYVSELPVVFYGSSITQGGCASRPGNSYQAILSRALDMEYTNLGFSGCGRAEDAMIEYVADLSMHALVLDYDHNAPTPQYLQMTHERFYRAVREKHPDMPILLLSKPDIDTPFTDAPERRAIIEATYRSAVEAGDGHVWFLGGEKLFEGENRWDCTVDGTHPNDLGFHRMAAAILPVLKEMLA